MPDDPVICQTICVAINERRLLSFVITDDGGLTHCFRVGLDGRPLLWAWCVWP